MGTHNKSIEVNAVDFSKCLETYGIPYYMKIDIEGAEMQAFKGMRGILEKQRRIVLMCELWPEGLYECGSSPMEYVGFLHSLGFMVFSIHEGGTLRPLTQDPEDYLKRAGKLYLNVAAMREHQ